MAQFGKPKSYTDWLYTRPVIFFLGIMIVFIASAVYSRWQIERDLHERRVASEAALVEATQRKAELEKKVEYLEGERGIEEEIRKHFDVAREGETVIILTGEASDTPREEPPSSPPAPWYQFWR